MKQKAWLLTGFNTKISPDIEREFSATLKTTQIKPTFSRQDLGAGLNNFNIQSKDTNVNLVHLYNIKEVKSART